jgi:hypothetical protein
MSAATRAASYGEHVVSKAEERRVIIASSVGTVFEWYDFYLYAILAPFFAGLFFPPGNQTAALLGAFGAYAAGFLVRPFGAIIFGRVGDLVGRKYTFLVTIVFMGISTVRVGFLPTYASIGFAAPLILVLLRLVQGLALGGEYGGAATYVAEHAPDDKRGYVTSWIQTTATVGMLLALVVIGLGRAVMDDATFKAWAWRIPFWFSIPLVLISIYIRLKLNESPIFRRMRAGEGLEGSAHRQLHEVPEQQVRRPGPSRRHRGAGRGVVHGAVLRAVLHPDLSQARLHPDLHVDRPVAAHRHAVLPVLRRPVGPDRAEEDHPGRLPDRGGDLLPALQGTHPLHQSRARAVPADDPDLGRGERLQLPHLPRSLVPADRLRPCQGLPGQGGASFTSLPAEDGKDVVTRIGNITIEGWDQAKFGAALKDTGYPPKANLAEVNWVMAELLLIIMVIYVTMVYGPIAAFLVELFPTKIRYTSMSLPYHIGNGWFGGMLPLTATAMVAATGDIYYGLWYPIVVAIMSLIIGSIFLRETKDRDIRTYEHA